MLLQILPALVIRRVQLLAGLLSPLGHCHAQRTLKHKRLQAQGDTRDHIEQLSLVLYEHPNLKTQCTKDKLLHNVAGPMDASGCSS